MRIPSSKLLLHNNRFLLPSQEDMVITHESFTMSSLYFSFVFVTWKRLVLKLIPIYFNNNETESMFFAWIDKKNPPTETFSAFWKDLPLFLNTFQKLVTTTKIKEILSIFKQIWSMTSVTTWEGLTQKEILLCNMEKIYNTKNKLWVILYQDVETNHYLVEENCMKIIRKINQNQINAEFVMFHNAEIQHAGKSTLLVQ